MPILIRKFNYGNISLRSLFTGESVGIRTKGEEPVYKPFLGFAKYIDVDTKRLPQVKVKLDIYGYYPDNSMNLTPIGKDNYVLGVLTPLGVYALMDEVGEIITLNTHQHLHSQ